MTDNEKLPDDIEKLIEDYRDAVYGDAVFDHLKDGGAAEAEVDHALRARIAEIVAEHDALKAEAEAQRERATMATERARRAEQACKDVADRVAQWMTVCTNRKEAGNG